MIHIGFTGTRHGMTVAQLEAVRYEMWTHVPISDGSPCPWLHHGDCIGADAQAHDIARELGYTIAGHPSTHRLRAWKHCDLLHEALAPFARNRYIVSECELLVAAPAETEHQERGGTWYTHDYALKLAKPVVLVLPDGTVRR